MMADVIKFKLREPPKPVAGLELPPPLVKGAIFALTIPVTDLPTSSRAEHSREGLAPAATRCGWRLSHTGEARMTPPHKPMKPTKRHATSQVSEITVIEYCSENRRHPGTFNKPHIAIKWQENGNQFGVEIFRKDKRFNYWHWKALPPKRRKAKRK
jgi:hypothetical protein